MKNYLSLLIVAILGTAICCCAGADTEQTLCQAESDIVQGDIRSALSSCDQLADSTSGNLSSTQMCRVAIIYAKASEISDNHDYMVTATKCYDRAVTLDINYEALDRYISSLDIESQNLVREIRDVAQALNSPTDYLEDFSDQEYDTDTLPAGQTTAHPDKNGTI